MPKPKNFCEWNGHKAGLLSYTSDMACPSFDLPAGRGAACPMIRDDDKSYVCHGCYAQLNRYNMPNVLDAQWIRFMWTKACLATQDGRLEWIAKMVKAIRQESTNGYFRGHSSGDFFHPDYVDMWHQVCSVLPNIRFWFPTRSYPHSGPMSAKWENALRRLAALPNVIVRPSALRYDEPAPTVPWLGDGSTVVSAVAEATRLGVVVCPKTIHHGSCETNGCRECWEPGHAVAYLVHGSLGRSVAANAQSPKIVALRGKARDKFTGLTLSAKGATMNGPK